MYLFFSIWLFIYFDKIETEISNNSWTKFWSVNNKIRQEKNVMVWRLDSINHKISYLVKFHHYLFDQLMMTFHTALKISQINVATRHNKEFGG